MDYSRCAQNNKYYAGAEEKIGITLNGEDWILKFPKKTEVGDLKNCLSEHIGSSIFAMCGFNAQMTSLGVYKGRNVVAVKDFVNPGEIFVPFNDVGDSTIDDDRERFHYTYDDIMTMLEENAKLTDVSGTIDLFWQMYLMDAMLGNFDRHGGNWGFIKKNDKYALAPIFDNGSCLFPRLNTDEACQAILDDPDEIKKRAIVFPTSQIRLDGRKSSYYDIISSLRYERCNEALLALFRRIDIYKIECFIDSIETISPMRKRFYKTILEARYTILLKEPYEKLTKIK